MRGVRILEAHSYAAGKRIVVGELVDEIARITPKREVGSVVVVAVSVVARVAVELRVGRGALWAAVSADERCGDGGVHS